MILKKDNKIIKKDKLEIQIINESLFEFKFISIGIISRLDDEANISDSFSFLLSKYLLIPLFYC